MPTSTPGHLFVVNGDLTTFRADDILVPCDRDLNVTAGFKDLLDSTLSGPFGVVPQGVTGPMEDGPQRRPRRVPRQAGGSRVWLVNTAMDFTEQSQEEALEWLIAGVRRALAEVSSQQGAELTRRSRRLVAMPLVGIGAGGFAQVHDHVIRRLLQALHDECARPGGPDVVLVLRHRSDYAAVQRHRPVPVTNREEDLQRLAKLGRQGLLVPFIGAGLSRAGGLPGWGELLADLAKAANWDDYEPLKDRLPYEDQAQIIGRLLGAEKLREAVAARMGASTVPLPHALLAGMRLREAITTNYDQLYEDAYRATSPAEPLVVIPGSKSADQAADTGSAAVGRETLPGPWLVKMHGDLASGRIVLTREDYLAFDVESVPLASLVQAHMVTRHLLFVGYSLSDGNFIRFAHQVQGIYKPYGTPPPIGTVLQYRPNTAMEKLWGDAFGYVLLGSDGDDSDGARQLEIFLDALAAAMCTEAPYLLDRRYENLLDPEDQRLASALRELRPTGETAVSLEMQGLLRRYGLGGG